MDIRCPRAPGLFFLTGYAGFIRRVQSYLAEESSRSSLSQTVRYACVPRLEKFNSRALCNLPTYRI